MAKKEKPGKKKEGILERLGKKRWYRLYQKYLKLMGIRIEPLYWILIAVIWSVVLGGLTFLAIDYFYLDVHVFAIIVPILMVDAMLGIPYLNAMNRVNRIEKAFPDALKQISDTLRSGSTYESALREVATPDFGPLGEEMQEALRKLEEGENFSKALNTLADNVDSKLVRRVVAVIIDAVAAGAGLAEVLEEIAEDARETYRVKTERKTKTILQTLFIIMSGAGVSPFIFGMVVEIVNFLMITAMNAGISTAQSVANAAQHANDTIFFLVQFYLFVEVLASSVVIAIMREGKLTKSLIYFPALLLIGFLIFHGARFFISFLLLEVGGVGVVP